MSASGHRFCTNFAAASSRSRPATGDDAEEHKIVDVLFKEADHEDNATCVSAMTTILMHGLGKYYDQCMSDSIARDGTTAQTAVKIANGFSVHTIDVHVVWARALKLCELKNSGLTADDLESAPYTYFSQSNATYPSAMTFVEGLDHIVSWTLAWAERMRMCDRATSDGRVLTIIRNAITIVLPELDHDNLVGYDTARYRHRDARLPSQTGSQTRQHRGEGCAYAGRVRVLQCSPRGRREPYLLQLRQVGPHPEGLPPRQCQRGPGPGPGPRWTRARRWARRRARSYQEP